MKWLVLMVMVNLMGCALFTKTSKHIAVNERETANQSYLDKVDVKTASKETHYYTWWNDSAAYQYQIIREQVDEKKEERLKSSENELQSNKRVEKEHTPVKIWMYAGVILFIAGVLLIIKKLRIFRHSDAMQH